MLRLYGYFRSSASYRARIALNLKGLEYEQSPVHLLHGDQQRAEFIANNPAALVPVLEDGELRISQSLAIIAWLDETRPEPPLLPKTPIERAKVRQVALAIACDIHPLNNLRVLKYLKEPLDASEERRNEWARHWIGLGLAALETELTRTTQRGRYCFGDTPGLADCCLIPQLFNSRRFATDLAPYPRLLEIEAACAELEAFRRARPSEQPDAE